MIRFEIKQLFFDRKDVQRKVQSTTRKVLSRFGAFVRRTARSSIRKRKRASKPGSPPSSHTGLLKRFIFFGYDRSQASVVIGPQRLSKKGKGQAPRLLEYGGSYRIKRRGKRKQVRMTARPFMGPAFAKEKPKLPQMWKNSVK